MKLENYELSYKFWACNVYCNSLHVGRIYSCSSRTCDC